MKAGHSCAAIALLATLLGTGTAARSATVSIAPFGTAADGQIVQLATLRNRTGMVVKLSSRGGTIIEVEAPDRTGKLDNVVLGRPAFAEWEKSGAFNSIVGRYANRLDHGGFTLDGVFYPLAGVNKTTNVAIHGGPNGFASRLWTMEPIQRRDGAGVALHYVSADGENGYPGELSVTVTYMLSDANVLSLDYRATTTKPTVVNLTNHTYWNMGGAASGPIYDEIMQVFASRWTPTDERQIPTGEIASVAGTPFDFRQPARVGDRIYSTHPQMLLAKGLDHNFVLDKPAGVAVPVAVRLHDPKSGRILEVRTTEPGVQIYSSNHMIGAMTGANGRTLRQGDALAFETQHFPDGPNKPNFPSTVLRPGQSFQSRTEFAFSTDAELRK